MRPSLVATKLFTPLPRPNAVLRPRLIARLNAGLHHKLTLISAPAGFGKTTLVASWRAERMKDEGRGMKVGQPDPSSFILHPSSFAWLSLDAADSDPTRFLTYLIAALQTIAPEIGVGVMAALQSPRPPLIETLLPTLLNEIATMSQQVMLILDDYHVLDARPIDRALALLIEHMPPQLHLVITTREDPPLPLARLRARDQLSELRAADLRFTPDEAATFLNQVMGLGLAAEDVSAIERRAEGWIAGLQLAALSLREREDVPGFIRAFAGDNRFIVDYLVEEVLQRQPAHIQHFLLQTSILDRLCGPLCDAVVKKDEGRRMKDEDRAISDAALHSSSFIPHPSSLILHPSSLILAQLERANLFLVPLDNERRWYRYHQLFADVLRHRLASDMSADMVATLHGRASVWYEDNGLELEAFRHAAAANDMARAEHLIEGGGMPLHFRGAGAPVRAWLESLPKTTLDARPSLWVTYASTVLFGGQHTAVEPKLQAAEAALHTIAPDDRTADLVGRIASMRATLAIMQHDATAIMTQSRRALAYLHPENRPTRTAMTYTLGYAYQLQGDRAAASQAYTDVIATGTSFGDSIYTIAATINLGQIQESNTQLALATTTYRRVLQVAGDPPDPIACEAYLGLARIAYQWNDLDAAQQHGHHCLQLMQQIEYVDTFASYALLLARLKLAQHDAAGAAATLDEAEAFAHQHGFGFRMPEVAAAQVLVLLRQGHLGAAAQLAATHQLPISQARVQMAQGDPQAALALLEPLRRQAEAREWRDEQLTLMLLQAVALYRAGERAAAITGLSEALALAKPGGAIRLFVDEGLPMAGLLAEARAEGLEPTYVSRLLAAFPLAEPAPTSTSPVSDPTPTLLEPLSDREREVLQLIAEGLSNQDIAARLYLSLHTVKAHARNIYGKLGVNTRTQAVARGKALGLLAQT